MTDEVRSAIELSLMIAPAVNCSPRFGENMNGPVMSIDLACSSAANAIWLDSGKIEIPGVDNNMDENNNTDNTFLRCSTKMTPMSI